MIHAYLQLYHISMMAIYYLEIEYKSNTNTNEITIVDEKSLLFKIANKSARCASIPAHIPHNLHLCVLEDVHLPPLNYFARFQFTNSIRSQINNICIYT